MIPGYKRLKTMTEIRRYVGNVINRLEKGEIDEVRVGKLGYLSNIKVGEIRIVECNIVHKRGTAIFALYI